MGMANGVTGVLGDTGVGATTGGRIGTAIGTTGEDAGEAV
jgi:hypothetical protein